jgi:hypothetical protein
MSFIVMGQLMQLNDKCKNRIQDHLIIHILNYLTEVIFIPMLPNNKLIVGK